MRSIQELENLTKKEMTDEEFQFRQLLIERIISCVLHLAYGDDPSEWSYERTDRLLIYQEDILKLCQYGGGMSLARSDDCRRAMGKKKMELMKSFEDEFLESWEKNIGMFGRPIWDMIVEYAKYCFNKSHAVCYTQITLKTAELCLPQNRMDFMLYNYQYSDKPAKKAAAMNHMLEMARLKFPDTSNPFHGLYILTKKRLDYSGNEISAMDIEVKSMEETLKLANLENLLDKSYKTMAELFMADLPASMKFELICRGIYDRWSLDICGLAKLNKAMGKSLNKYNELPKEIFNTGNLDEILNILNMQSKFEEYYSTPEMYKILPKKSPRARKDPEWIYIYKGNDIGSWPADVTKYRTQQLKKQFSVIKKNGLSSYSEDMISDLKDMAGKINEILDKVKDNNPGMKINNKNFQSVMKKVPKIYERFQLLKKNCEEMLLTGYVSDKMLLKNGSCMVVFNFSENYDQIKFYTRDKDVIQSIDKGQIVNFHLKINDTIWRGDLKVYPNIALA